ncbi:MAG: hypothetical protein ACOYNL_03155 [Rickettsiales bacterium]
MLINQSVSRETWRKLLASLKQTSEVKFVPEYDEGHDTHVNKRYYR